ncbi:S1/P1 nuclease [Gluconacetobacter diazotrophicus]|uniref:S1/P1 nuclease n=1 Tax=Gluconacetobacter diazotrophicus TaxID=33996 RepID=UPI00119B7F63|nr:S1/P1 nuclease [Gluconacetobacter diazotrophicus]TWB10981.1 S1/P1 nuclease [Gluconacetobacter diazotrophicus]
MSHDSRFRRGMTRLLAVGLLALAGTLPDHAARAWGREGHAIVADLAWDYLSPDTRQKVTAILAQDHDTLTAPDLAARASWADAWRAAGHKETGSWHFVDLEIDWPDLAQACYGFPSAQPASTGPAQDCVVNKLQEFTRELADPATTPAERVLALKYVVHFVGDIHQPLHAADRHDKGGNCVRLAMGGPRTVNLHSYWDSVTVSEIDPDARHFADTLFSRITVAQKNEWSQGDARQWAEESFSLARDVAYHLDAPSGCDPDAAPVSLPPGYDAAARDTATLQLEKAGVRLAWVLNRSLADLKLPSPTM